MMIRHDAGHQGDGELRNLAGRIVKGKDGHVQGALEHRVILGHGLEEHRGGVDLELESPFGFFFHLLGKDAAQPVPEIPFFKGPPRPLVGDLQGGGSLREGCTISEEKERQEKRKEHEPF